MTLVLASLIIIRYEYKAQAKTAAKKSEAHISLACAMATQDIKTLALLAAQKLCMHHT